MSCPIFCINTALICEATQYLTWTWSIRNGSKSDRIKLQKQTGALLCCARHPAQRRMPAEGVGGSRRSERDSNKKTKQKKTRLMIWMCEAVASVGTSSRHPRLHPSALPASVCVCVCVCMQRFTWGLTGGEMHKNWTHHSLCFLRTFAFALSLHLSSEI